MSVLVGIGYSGILQSEFNARDYHLVDGAWEKARDERHGFMNVTTENYPFHPGYKTTSPDTSFLAAKSVSSFAGGLRERCLAAIAASGSTADEVAAMVGYSVLAVRPRLSELVRTGKVAATPHRRTNASGKSAAVWAVREVRVQGEMFS